VLSVSNVPCRDLELLGTSALYLAAKYSQDSSNNLPIVQGSNLSPALVFSAEVHILRLLNLTITKSPATEFITRISQVQAISTIEIDLRFIFYLSGIGSLDIHLVGTLPSCVVAAALWLYVSLLGKPSFPQNFPEFD
jgi:hypothetical protein